MMTKAERMDGNALAKETREALAGEVATAATASTSTPKSSA